MSKSFPIFISVNPQEESSLTLSDNGSRITVHPENALSLPPEAKNPVIYLSKMSFFNNFPNIESDDELKFEYTTDDENYTTLHTINLTQGLYSAGGLNHVIQEELKLNESKFTPLGVDIEELFVLRPNAAIEKIEIYSNIDTWIDDPNKKLRVSVSPNLARVIGFGQTISFDNTFTLKLTAPNVAKFSYISALLIDCSLVNGSVSLMNNQSNKQYFDMIQITARPGSQVNYVSQNPIKVPIDIVGKRISDFQIQIVGENEQPVKMITTYSLTLVIEYD